MILRSNLEMGRRQLGELSCTVVGPAGGKSPEFCVVLCHGFGAPGTDLVPLGQELADLVPKQVGTIAYIFPEAPLELGGYGFAGRAWWMVDVERFQRAAGNPREMAALRADIPPGMAESSRLLQGCLKEAERQTGVPISRTVLGGFSQGSMVATDVALRLPTPPAGLCIFSGTLLAESQWEPLAKKRGDLSVLQTHGTYDPLLPFAGAEALRDLLTESGLAVEFVAFDGPHTIPLEGLDRCAALMSRVFARGGDQGQSTDR